MFCIVYEFIVQETHQSEFQKIWHQLTMKIRDNCKGLGSRLHQNINKMDSWIAYAQWPDRETWLKYTPLNVSNSSDLTIRMKEICNKITILYELETVDDLLLK